MISRKSWAESLVGSLLITISLILTFVAISLVAIYTTNSNSDAFGEIFDTLWPLFAAILFVVFFLVLFFFRFPLQFFFISLLLASFIFIVSSFNGNDISLFIRDYIDSTFNINYLATGATLSALLFAIISLRRNNHNNHD